MTKETEQLRQDIDDLIKRLKADGEIFIRVGYPEYANNNYEAAEALRQQQDRIAQDVQWIISYQKLLEEAGKPPSSTDIIEAWKTAKVQKVDELLAEIERLEDKIYQIGIKHPQELCDD